MDSPLPPDPYNALGLAKDATPESIKKAYRKLALRLHPDKCTDDSQKAHNTEEFHKVQQAYDIVGDEDKRARYDAQIRLAELRRQNMELRGEGPRVDVRTAAYDVRTAAPRGATFTTRGPTREYEDRSRARYYEYDEAPPRTSTRKTADFEYANVKRSSPPRESQRESQRESERNARARAAEREAEERRRTVRAREADVRESRSRKYDTREDYEDDRRRRDRLYEEEERRRKTESAKRPPLRREEVHSSYSSSTRATSTERKMEEQFREAQRHQEARSRPSSYRTTPSRDVPQSYYEDLPRRSTAAPKDERTRRTSPGKENDRRAPNLTTHASSPPVMEPSREREVPHRSYTTQTDVDPRRKQEKDASPPPSFSRSATMPAPPSTSTSSRRKDSTTAQPSKLRHSQTAVPTEATYAPPVATPEGYTTKTYRYTDAGVPVIANGHKAVLREPSTTEGRPASNTAAKMASLASKTARYAYADPASVRPSVSHSSSSRAVPSTSRTSRSPEQSSRRDRERERERERYADERTRPTTTTKLYGESGPGRYAMRPQPTSYRPEDISFAKRFDEQDVSYSKRGSRDRESEFIRPTMPRSATFAY
jgi:curved DNA-binding protein CbpA